MWLDVGGGRESVSAGEKRSAREGTAEPLEVRGDPVNGHVGGPCECLLES